MLLPQRPIRIHDSGKLSDYKYITRALKQLSDYVYERAVTC